MPPRFLYHGSSNKKLKVINPVQGRRRDSSEPTQIFATPKKEVAAMFMTPSDDSWTGSGSFDRGHNTWYKVISDRQRYIQLDLGGAIYTVPAESFSFDPSKGLGQYEFTTTQPVTPVSKEEFGSTLETMLSMGVQVYFIDKDILEKTRRNPKDLLKILESIKSENQKRNMNIKPLRSDRL